MERLSLPAIPMRLVLLAAVFLLLLPVACRAEPTPTPTPAPTATATPAPTPTPTPEEREALAAMWEGAQVLRRSYVETGAVPLDALVAGAIQGMLDQAKVPLYPFLTRLGQVQEPPPQEMPEGLEDVWKAWRLLSTEQPGLDPGALARGAIRGMLRAAGDPIAEFLSEGQSQEAQEFFTGTYEGIGAIVQLTESGLPVVTAVVADGPADVAGLLPGDMVLAVDGEPVQGLSLPEVVRRLKGPEGTQVTLRVQQGGEAPRDIVVTRRKVSLPTVATDVLPGDVGYMLVARFADTTGPEVRDALARLLAVPVKALILDLRDNPGGSMEAAVTLVSQFVESGLAYYEVDNQGQRKDWPVEGAAPAPLLPLAVVIDGSTMSAAETVAGALQDHGRARLFGVTSFGKGTLDAFQQLPGGSTLYVAVARWYTPNGRNVQGTGLEPDVVVRLTQQDIQQQRDRQLQEAYSYLRSLVEAPR